MGSAGSDASWRESRELELPALVIGGGFGGIYTLWRLRQIGIGTKLVEAGQELGGVWQWNRYPGARVDSEMPFYQFTAPEIWRDWTWSERFPGHVELRQYFHYCATTLGLYDHIAFGENIIGCDFDNERYVWIVKSDTGKIIRCKYLIVACGSSYKKHFPDFAGLEDYQGQLFHAAQFPTEEIEFVGKRFAVIGQGATGIQLVQEISKKAEHLGVYCRTPNIALPMKQRKFTVEEQNQYKAYYPYIFKMARETRTGIPYYNDGRTALGVSKEEREAKWEEVWERGAFNFQTSAFRDFLVSQEANDLMYEFWRNKVLARLKDPRKREIMAPEKAPHPVGTKRPSLEQDYYECLERSNVELISLKDTPISKFDTQGIITSDGISRKYDTIILATGYDAVTGSFTSMGLRDVNGVDMKERWKHGVRTHLGMTCPGFPNMFMVYSPQAPTSLANGTTIIEIQGDWVVSTIEKMRKEGIETLDALPEAAEKWAADIQAMNEKTLFPLANSWYMGANIPGKKREQLIYLGGVDNYERICKEHQVDWKGFKTTSVNESRSNV